MNKPATAAPLSAEQLDIDTLWEIHGVVKNAGSVCLAHKIADAIAQARAAQPAQTGAAVALAPLPSTNLAARLAEYATNRGYTWSDYANVMQEASDAIHAIAKWNHARAILAPVAAQQAAAPSPATD